MYLILGLQEVQVAMRREFCRLADRRGLYMVKIPCYLRHRSRTHHHFPKESAWQDSLNFRASTWTSERRAFSLSINMAIPRELTRQINSACSMERSSKSPSETREALPSLKAYRQE